MPSLAAQSAQHVDKIVAGLLRRHPNSFTKAWLRFDKLAWIALDVRFLLAKLVARTRNVARPQMKSESRALTRRQKEVLTTSLFETKRYAPIRRIGKGLKLNSMATVHKHITTAREKGLSGEV